MRFQKANTEILFETMNNNLNVYGRKGKLLCSFIGTVEIGTNFHLDNEGCPDWDANLYLAGQLPTGEIIYIDNENKAHSLSDKIVHIWWGEYPPGFPEEQKTKRPCPRKFRPHIANCRKYKDSNEDDELPF